MGLMLSRRLGEGVQFTNNKTGNIIVMKVIAVEKGLSCTVAILDKKYTFYNQQTKSGFSAPFNFELDGEPISVMSLSGWHHTRFQINASKKGVRIDRV